MRQTTMFTGDSYVSRRILHADEILTRRYEFVKAIEDWSRPHEQRLLLHLTTSKYAGFRCHASGEELDQIQFLLSSKQFTSPILTLDCCINPIFRVEYMPSDPDNGKDDSNSLPAVHGSLTFCHVTTKTNDELSKMVARSASEGFFIFFTALPPTCISMCFW